MDFVNTAELADVIDDGVEVVGGDLCSDAETTGVVIGAAVVLVVDGEDVEPLAGEVVHKRVGHSRLLRDLEIERDTPRRPGAVRKQYDLTRPGKGRRIAGSQPLLPDIEFNRLAIGARNALDPVLRTGNRLVGRRHGRVQRSEEHTSELQSRGHLVCRLLLEKKNKNYILQTSTIM